MKHSIFQWSLTCFSNSTPCTFVKFWIQFTYVIKGYDFCISKQPKSKYNLTTGIKKFTIQIIKISLFIIIKQWINKNYYCFILRDIGAPDIKQDILMLRFMPNESKYLNYN